MAIERMRRVTVLAPSEQLEELLEELQGLGALHLVPLGGGGETPPETQARLTQLRRCLTALRAQADRGKKRRGAPLVASPDLSGLADREIVTRAEAALARHLELEGRHAALLKEREAAEPFGAATATDVRLLSAAGLQLRAYRLPQGAERKLRLPDGAFSSIFPLGRRGRGLVVATFGAPPALDLEPLDPPARPLAAIDAELGKARAAREELRAEFAALESRRAALLGEAAALRDRQRLLEARAGARADEDLFAVSGWCPAPRTEEVRRAVLARGGATLLEDPAPGDEPPIAYRNARIVGFFEPLLKAFQTPNYREPDPTPLIAPFMAVFFGFCLGDAAYGLLLFVAATLLRRKLRAETGDLGKVFRLFQLLGLVTVGIGLLNGLVFGVPLYEIGWIKSLGLTPERVPTFRLSAKPENFFYFALVLGVIQCCAGLFIRMALQIRARRWQDLLGTLGWFGCMPGVAVWYALGTPAAFYAALGLIILFKNPVASFWRRVGGGAWGLYEWVLGLFGDIMSYLRIFGLGLSSGIIAVVVNTIAGMVIDSGSVVGWLGGGLILIVGHSFNFAMSVLGSTVHSARLQFLEYFGKFFEGGGRLYEPFTRVKEGGSS